MARRDDYGLRLQIERKETRLDLLETPHDVSHGSDFPDVDQGHKVDVRNLETGRLSAVVLKPHATDAGGNVVTGLHVKYPRSLAVTDQLES
jgi:hypothetical protein